MPDYWQTTMTGRLRLDFERIWGKPVGGYRATRESVFRLSCPYSAIGAVKLAPRFADRLPVAGSTTLPQRTTGSRARIPDARWAIPSHTPHDAGPASRNGSASFFMTARLDCQGNRSRAARKPFALSVSVPSGRGTATERSWHSPGGQATRAVCARAARATAYLVTVGANLTPVPPGSDRRAGMGGCPSL